MADDTETRQPLTQHELDQLGRYNAEVARGLIHGYEWKLQMAQLQARFNAVGHEPAKGSVFRRG